MSMNRRAVIRLIAGAVPALASAQIAEAEKFFHVQAAAQTPAIAKGPFSGTRESLQSYTIPEWFRDAKFGMWAHWGPQSAAEAGDWYARNMYIPGSRQYKHHLDNYGHPSKTGHKDLIQTWKGDKFDPDYLMGLYKKAGAKYFMSMGVHHDNFDLWNSKYTQWNAVKMGVKKDVVGMWRAAAEKHGLKFAVSDHLWISYKWFAVSHRSDTEGPLAGVAYDGADSKYRDLYHDYREVGEIPPVKLDWNEDGIPESWKRHWFLRIKDLVDNYHPDLLYSDGHIPFEEYGLSLVAHLYNTSAARNSGKVDAVYTSKRREDSQIGTCALDVERGLVDTIWPTAWQTDTCVGEWHYNRDAKYKTPKVVVDMLVDVVSRNGNLMLNFPLPNSGMLDDRELSILDGITKWMSVNSEAIYGTRPWKIFGQGPGTQSSATPGSFNEGKRKDLTIEDVRFTTRGNWLYAFVMGWPEAEAQRQITIAPLGTTSEYAKDKITNVELLGNPGKLEWAQGDAGLKIQLPAEKPCEHAIAFRISGLA
jgi:alpha-L-fucosidase